MNPNINPQQQPTPPSPPSEPKKSKFTVIVISIAVVILVAGGLIWYFVKNNNQKQNSQPTTLNSNQTKISMNNIDPKAQILIDQYLELTKKISAQGRKGDLTPEDEKIMDEMGQISDELNKYNTAKIRGAISTFSYGYDLSISINGKDIGVKGGGSSSRQLFDSESIMALISTPDVREHNYVLNKGENTITINYKRIDGKDTAFPLTVDLLAYSNDKVLTLEVKDKAQGSIEKTFILENTKPADFQTIEIKE